MSEKTDAACEEEEYENFTGIIMRGDNEGIVETATFELRYTFIKEIFFYSGVWLKGVWYNGNWCGGTWDVGNWKNGYWGYGARESGTWNGGVWFDDIWMNGIWCGGGRKRGIDSKGKLRLDSLNFWRM